MPTITWNQTGGVTVDGQKRFLFGLYGVHEPDFAEVAEAGFNFVHSYRWDGAGSNAEAIAYLDAAHGHGLQAFIGFHRRLLMKGDEAFVAERVGALMSHPGLFAWYLYDEPDLDFQYVAPKMLTRYYRLIKALDPFHPVIVTCAGDSAVPLYRDACDVYWVQVYRDTAFVADRMDRTRELLHPGQAMMAILHCYDAELTELRQRNQPFDADRFQPDALTLRANAFMALVHNSSCLAWWQFEKQSQQFFSVGHYPPAWEALKSVIADIRGLEPILTAEGKTRMWVERSPEGGQVHCWEKKVQDRTALVAVNRDPEPCEVTITPELAPVRSMEHVPFGPLQVRTYQW